MTKARVLANTADALSATSSTELGYLTGVTSAIQTQINTKQPTVANVSDAEIGYLDGVTSAIQTQLDAKQAVVSGVSDTEIGYLDGVTSAIQTQLDAKLATATAASTYQPIVSGVDNTEIGYLNGVTSAIQTQLNAKAPLASPTLTGTVGINIAPSAALHVSSASDEVTRLQSSGNPYISWYSGATRRAYIQTGPSSITFNSDGAIPVILGVNNGERMRINTDGATTVSYTTTTGGAVRNTYMSTSAPAGGSDGDVWIQYT